ncbi:RNA-binding protein [Gorillibacterium massiliense]|uniref:YlmH family RNA-binding protein n=1 Tax=Gorillibacterium massiliense TaxID=1280390 RepID=UPI0004BA5422|nr:YlmH/Sll1252 family protein [Gorillibacterium massiliense]
MVKEWYSHFRPDEHAFVDRAAEWLERAAERHEIKVTDFLDPRQASILETVANRYAAGDAAFALNGGYPGAERQRGILVPGYRDPLDVDPGIRVLAIKPADDKFIKLEHGDYMGSILGLGIKRDKVGDIHVLDDGCHCLVAAEISDYMRLNLQQVHRTHVQTELLPLAELRTAITEFEEINLSVASMRLDGIVSDLCRLSRAKAQDPIRAGRCRVNWKVEEDPSRSLQEGDVLSIQGFGRFKLLQVEGVSKKGRIRLKAGKFK